MEKKITVLDSTLRDGAQGEGISFSIEDKLAIVKALDNLGIDYIEACNPFSNPKDIEFFQRLNELELKNSKIVAFGSTRRKDCPAEEDKNLKALLNTGTPAVAIFGKCWLLHVTEIIKTDGQTNYDMIYDTVSFLKKQGKTVFFDAEHFFDGYKDNPEYAMGALQAAFDAGADSLDLCDTNGGCFPDEIAQIVSKVSEKFGDRVGIHTHNDN